MLLCQVAKPACYSEAEEQGLQSQSLHFFLWKIGLMTSLVRLQRDPDKFEKGTGRHIDKQASYLSQFVHQKIGIIVPFFPVYIVRVINCGENTYKEPGTLQPPSKWQ